ncbi:Homeodomain-like protein [Suillus subluteus]|nr:Homeodomain-like protein [Suillus subluteus]
MSQTNCTEAVKEAIQANKDHQHALKVYTERLEAELQTVDKLLEPADANLDGEPDIDVGGSVLIPGSVKASGLLAPSELLSEDSPFYEEAARRSRYLSLTEAHPMTKKDLETLREAVRTENYRMHALDAQRKGNPVFTSLSNQPSNYLELNKEGLDWDRIAEKVSSSSMYMRTPRECEIRWLGDQHPCFNHSSWTQDEVTKLKGLVAEYGNEQVDWEAVVDKLGTHRMPLDCMIHGTTPKIHLWTPDSDERLLKAVATLGHDNWSVVACQVSEDATPSQCQNRYQRTLDPALKHKAWSDEEDSRLRLAVQAYGTSWVYVASVIPGRHNDQCRDRWNDILNPAVTKGRWTEEEDQDLLTTVQQLGTSSWKEISNRLGSGRTDSMVIFIASEAHVSFSFILL